MVEVYFHTIKKEKLKRMRFFATLHDFNGKNHIVHHEHCELCPGEGNRFDLGEHFSCQTAVAKARSEYKSNSNGCYHCSRLCHQEAFVKKRIRFSELLTTNTP